jgi:SAM-dependent methyltransferase
VRGDATVARLVDAASGYYRGAGRFAWHFARGKLTQDPAFAALLARGLLAGRARILDLGCGQGLLAAWLLAARAAHDSGNCGAWPRDWPAPPVLQSYLGVDINPRDVARARHALTSGPDTRLQIVQGDIREVDFDAPDAVVILDVLHYIDYPSQEEVLQRVRAALAPQGLLLLRVSDADAGLGFALGQAVDRTVALFRSGRWLHPHYRSVRAWQDLLARGGFSTQALPMSDGTPYANILLLAQAR